MRIRAKKGAVILGVIAGAAIATALTVYNVNVGNSVNVSDIEDSGLLNGLAENVEEALNGGGTSAVIADANAGDTAASAGVMGDVFGEDAQKNEDGYVAPASDPAEEESAFVNSDDTGEAARQTDTDADSSLTVEEEDDRDVSAVEQVSNEQEDGEVQTYVEAVPQTRTETVVEEKIVSVEVPVSVVEEITVNEEADPVYFYSETGEAAVNELTTTRRAEEALAAQEADKARVEAAADESNASGNDWKVPVSDGYDDSFIVFN